MSRTDAITGSATFPILASPSVTVVMPTYNGERYLRAQIDSILTQSGVDLRLVIIDDASNDGTWNIIKSYADRYPNVIAFRNETNQGLIKTLKKLFSHIEGEYFSLADQDDVWDVNKLESSIGYMRQNLASLVYSDVRTIDGYGGVLQDRYLQNAKIKPHVGIDPIPFVFRNPAIGHTMVGRASLKKHLVDMPETILTQEHWIVACACREDGVVYLDRALGSYRQHGANVVGAREGLIKRAVNTLTKPNYFSRRRNIRKMALYSIALLFPNHADFATKYSGSRNQSLKSIISLFRYLIALRHEIGSMSVAIEIALIVLGK